MDPKAAVTFDPTELIKARENEIKALTKEVLSESGSKRAFQLLPRYMRRRTMSSNAYLVPSRLRAKALREIELGGTIKNTKKRRYRKTKRILNRVRHYKKRQITKKWLPTHLWHAKRFHMENKWGYRIARSPTNKGARAIYRAVKTESVIYDATHTAPIKLSGKQKELIFMLGHLSQPATANLLYLRGGQYGSNWLYEKKDAKLPKLVCPMEFYWKPLVGKEKSSSQDTNEMEREVWVFVHPAAFPEAHVLFLKFLNENKLDVIVTPLQMKFARFQLMGPKCNKVLTTVLHEVEPLVEHTSSSLADNMFRKVMSVKPSALPKRAVLSFTVLDPRVKKYIGLGVLRKPIPYAPPSITPPDFLLKWDPKWSHSFLWEVGEGDGKISFDENLSKAPKPGKGKGLWGKKNPSSTTEDKMDIAKDLPSLSNNNEQQAQKTESKFWGTCKVLERDINARKIPPSDLYKSRTEVMLMQNPGVNGYTSGWTFLCEISWATTFWRAFFKAGAKAIGYAEYEHMQFEAGVPSFPISFPDTLSGQVEADKRDAEESEKYLRRPPSKRPNFEKLGIHSPFRSPWASLFSSCDITDIRVLREDLSAYFSGSKAIPVGSLLPVWVWLPEGGTTIKPNARIYHPDYDNDHNEVIIGFVSNGKYSFKQGACKALAFVRADTTITILQKNNNRAPIYIRNIQSQWYHPAYATLHQDQ
uniref:Pop1 N-terminal domain-containing protein n=1 Tax=Arcella intermedia TaxID=1963864 RepID=A0A6B2KZ66_9EUKA|eukprot:TRINITY_DN26635_c0_g1_i1.p1 TRINITY_DN26635_c0_g1~~TRINITY_DN26635_c0_g1_i1.p1  ORF type:complete len:713 (+),score=138.30 TRINITY_DN26635_c0_g1_i1:40-2139(+)